MEAWDHGVSTIEKIAKQYPQSEYSKLGMSLKLEWQQLQRTVPGVGNMMGPIEYDLIGAFLPAISFG